MIARLGFWFHLFSCSAQIKLSNALNSLLTGLHRATSWLLAKSWRRPALSLHWCARVLLQLQGRSIASARLHNRRCESALRKAQARGYW